VSESIPRLLQRSEVRLAAFGLAAVTAVYLGFLGVSVGQAQTFIRDGGYYVLLLTFGLWIFSLWRLRQERGSGISGWPGREKAAVGLVILLFTGVAISQESFRSKILNDEFVLQSTAFNMHFTREVSAMARGYDILGQFVCTDLFLDKRPNFYPFLVSLVHDFTGYRPTNALFLNAVLLPVALGLAYYLGRGLAGWRGGMLAVGLLGSLPLFAQNATGSGMELVNLTMLLASVALAAAYLASPSEGSLSAFVLAAVLLAQCRYESALYVLPAALVVLAGWWRTRRITLPWITAGSPLLLVTVALHNKVLSNSPVLWEMRQNQTSRFGAEYVAANLQGAKDYFLSFRQNESNSVVLTVVGAAALLWVAWRLVARRRQLGRLEPHRLAWLLFGLGILANTILVMFYFWSSFADPMASRFSLPFYLLLVFAGVMFAHWCDRRLPVTPGLLFVVAVCFLGLSIPKQAHHIYSRVGIDEIEWERRFVATRPPGEQLILTNKSTLVWLLQKTPSIVLNRARMVADRLQFQLGEPGTFREILVMQSLRPSTAEGDHQLLPEDRLPAGFHLERLAERRFGTRIARISRLVAVETGETPSRP
jgi:hypothetical protein